MNKRTSIGVIFGGRSVEHEVSVESAKTVCSGLRRSGYEAVPLYVDRSGEWFHMPVSGLENGSLKPAVRIIPLFNNGKFLVCGGARAGGYLQVSSVFPVIHGTTGEDGSLQGFLEMAGLPYAGCGVLASAAGMDKVLSKTLAAREGIPVLKHVVVEKGRGQGMKGAFRDAAALGLPLFVKPAALGSSVGVSKVKRQGDLKKAVMAAFKYDDRVVIEKGVDRAREIVCGVLGDVFNASSSVCGEVIPSSRHEFFDYAAKYTDENGMELIVPARLSKNISRSLRTLSVRIFRALGCRGMARIDFLMNPENENEFYFCEINTVPGFTSHSLYPRLWAATGMNTAKLTGELVRLALKRHKLKSGLRTAI